MSDATSTLAAWCVLPDLSTVDAVSASITLDQAWSPYVQAQVVIPYTDERFAMLDPRDASPRVRVGIRRSWAGRPTLADLDEAWAGMTLADLSTEWAGLTLADLSAGWLVAWESGDRAPDELVCDLTVRRRAVDQAAGTITLTAMSDELLAQGARLVVSRPDETIPNRIASVLLAAGITPASVTVPPASAAGVLAATRIDMTTSVWEALTGAPLSTLRLWCDEARGWHLTIPSDPPTSTLHIDRVTAGDDDTNLDGDWADVVAITCHWTGADGVTQNVGTRTWPMDPTPGVHRVSHEDLTITEHGDAWPGPSYDELQQRWTRLQSHGRTQTLTAVLDPTARPGQTITTGAPSLPATTGISTAVTFRVPEDTMSITIGSTEAA